MTEQDPLGDVERNLRQSANGAALPTEEELGIIYDGFVSEEGRLTVSREEFINRVFAKRLERLDKTGE